MADDGDVDVLGDFDFKLEAGSEIYDTNELPSKSANLLPEYTNPPWMLEQGWNLEMDEKSKATIEKMLLEEQQYLSRKAAKPRRTVQNKLMNNPEKTENNMIASSSRRVWSEQEKQMLLKGMEIYGRSWTKIAELIPSRTSIQIKSFANQYFKAKEKVVNTPTEVDHNNKEDTFLQDTVAAVSTAKPTIPIRSIVIPNKGRIPKTLAVNNVKRKAVNSPTKIKRKKVPVKASKADRTKTKACQGLGRSSDPNLPIIKVMTDTKNHKVTIAPNLMENMNGACSVPNNATDSDYLSTDEIDIDIENDDDDNVELNPVLQSRSTSPNSVYEKLVSEANIKMTDQIDEQEKFGESGEMGSERNCNYRAENDLVKLSETCTRENDRVEMDTNGKDRNTKTAPIGPSGSEVNGRDGHNVQSDTKFEDQERQNVTAEDLGDTKTTDSPKKIYVNAITTVEGEVIHFPIPTCETILSPAEITPEERSVHPDFFGNKSSKTPERYLKIRNYILDSWKKFRPNFLNKTSVRPGLKNCGDVNCIGRIHAYLECIGAINFGCEQASYNMPKTVNGLVRKEKVIREQNDISSVKLESMRPRKRKVRDEFGYWIDEKELEGKTIPHKEESAPKAPKPKQIKSGYDPFKLVPCQLFSEDNPAPYLVELTKSALIVMDIHAHICKTEVIGMLGGRYCCDRGKLTVSMATPCNSISTGMQCEMDPVSQTQASEEIRGAGLEVIGWYHSHPVFDPNPSVRDMETQLKFQEWFAKGGSNFVGIIVSPYNPRNPCLGSEVNCLTVRKQRDDHNSDTMVPYKFEYTVCDSNDTSDITNLALTAQDLATSYSSYRNRVDLSSMYRRSGGVTCLNKLVESVRLQYGIPDQYLEELLDCIRKAFTSSDYASNHSNQVTTEMVSMTTDGLGEMLTVKGDS